MAGDNNQNEEDFVLLLGKSKMITRISVTLQCAFFLLVPLYAILVFAFSSSPETGDPRSSFPCPLIEENEERTANVNAKKGETEERRGINHKYGCKSSKQERKESIECLQTNCDSHSDESFYMQPEGNRGVEENAGISQNIQRSIMRIYQVSVS